MGSVRKKDVSADAGSNWRVFIAVALPDHARTRIAKHISRLRESVPHAQASWSRDENIHLTLKFLGSIPKTTIQALSDAVSRAVEELAPFPIVLERTGVFPSRRDLRVLWIGISDPEGKLMELHARLEAECARVGFPQEERQFHPHLTLARLRNPRFARELVQAHEQLSFDPDEVTVSDLRVIRSELSSTGSKYTVISRHPLQKAC